MRLILICLLFSTQLIAQQYFTNKGNVSFFSEAPIENISAINEDVSAIVDSQTGGFAFRLKIEDFTFPNSLMQEHFNESYLESEKYPLSTFTGVIDNFSNLDLSIKQNLKVYGTLSMHGISKDAQMKVTAQMINDELHISSTFNVALEDYDIDIPKIMMYKIAEIIQVVVDMKLQNRTDE
ncbi:MAG: YceI family protein [Flavobacteriales bacterium]